MYKESTVIIKPAKDNISRIVLNEPNTYNALSLKTLKALINSFSKLNDDKKTKVIINILLLKTPKILIPCSIKEI